MQHMPGLPEVPRVDHLAVDLEPPGLTAKASTIACARVISSAEGVKAALIASTCEGWIAIMPVKPSRRTRAA
jgi:hypothetical protein